jgi:hypothetical protein
MSDAKRTRFSAVTLHILSEDSGTKEDIAEFFKIVQEKYAKYFLQLTDDETDHKTVNKALKTMNKENASKGQQVHKGIVLKAADLDTCFEDAAREETEYFCIVVTPMDEEKEEEMLDSVSDLYNCQGLTVRKKDESMEAFVDALF